MVDPEKREPCELILASGSPRRIQMLEMLGIRLCVEPADIDEAPVANEAPGELVARLSRGKAESAWGEGREVPVLGSDTIVSLASEILGKPRDEADARRMLTQLSGEWHLVTSGVCVISKQAGCEVLVTKTEVKMRQIGDAELDWYLATGDPFDKAGAYAIQGAGGVFVERIRGNMHNVVGLPLPDAVGLLTRAGLEVLSVEKAALGR